MNRIKQKLLSRKDIEAMIPQLKGLSFPYWANSVARINFKKKRMIKNRLTFFYTPQAARKLEAALRKRKPELFQSQNQEA